ncbi:MAG TPA: DUF4239 domain-containing protein [Candidatus Binatia bacterium]
MSYTVSDLLLAGSLMFGMIILLEVGRRIGIRQIARDPDGSRTGLAVIDSAVFGLLGLIIAFTFSGAMSRLDARRQLIVQETNAIGTAYLRLHLLPPSAQPGLRDKFRRYVDSRLAVYQKFPDIAAAKAELAQSNMLQEEIWEQAVTASRAADAHPDAGKLLLPAINEMIDITTTRTMATQMHPPLILFVLLFGLSFGSALLAGYGTAGGKYRSWLHSLCFCIAIAVGVYVILDIEYPRFGAIRVDAFDQALRDLRDSMK